MLTRGAAPYSGNPLIRYVNVTINNPTGAANKTAEFDWTYDRSILQNAGEHTVSVVSFSLPLQNLPLFVFPIEPNQAYRDLSTLQVGLCHNLTQAQIAAGLSVAVTGNTIPLRWVPQELGLVLPVQDKATQVVTPFYYCYSYEHFVNIVNDAIQDVYINVATPANPTGPPEFSYDDDKHTFRWRVPTAFAGNTTGSALDGWSVCWNEAFDNLVNNFNTIKVGTTFILEDTLAQETNTVAGNVVLNQDYPTSDAFNSAQRILCTTTSIPIAADYFAAPYGQENTGGLSNTEKVLVDVSLDFDNNVGAQRSVLVYAPNLYQISDMESTLPLNRISLKFEWLDSLNNRYSIPVSKGDTIICKLGFFSKKMPYL